MRVLIRSSTTCAMTRSARCASIPHEPAQSSSHKLSKARPPPGDEIIPQRVGCELGRDRISVALAGYSRQPVRVVDPAIESHYGTGYERSRLFPGGNPSLEFVRSMELLDRLLPGRPRGCSMSAAALGPMPRRWPDAGTACIWWIRCRCTWSRHARQPPRSRLRLHRRRGRRARASGAG